MISSSRCPGRQKRKFLTWSIISLTKREKDGLRYDRNITKVKVISCLTLGRYLRKRRGNGNEHHPNQILHSGEREP